MSIWIVIIIAIAGMPVCNKWEITGTPAIEELQK